MVGVQTPSALTFLNRYRVVMGLEDRHYYLAMYFTELTLLEYKMLQYPPHLIATAAMYLSNRMNRMKGIVSHQYTHGREKQIAWVLCVCSTS